jgi:hypothetical protein
MASARRISGSASPARPRPRKIAARLDRVVATVGGGQDLRAAGAEHVLGSDGMLLLAAALREPATSA